MNTQMMAREALSGLFDNEESTSALDKVDEQALATWEAYQVIRAALQGDLPQAVHSVRRSVQQRISHEPDLHLPARRPYAVLAWLRRYARYVVLSTLAFFLGVLSSGWWLHAIGSFAA